MFEPKLTVKELRKSLDNIPKDYDNYFISVIDDVTGLMELSLLDINASIVPEKRVLYFQGSMIE